MLGPCHELIRVTTCPGFLKCEARAQTWLNLTTSHGAQLNHVIGDILCDISGFLFYYFLAYIHMCFIYMDVCEGVRSPGAGVTDRCELPRGLWKLSPGPQKSSQCSYLLS